MLNTLENIVDNVFHFGGENVSATSHLYYIMLKCGCNQVAVINQLRKSPAISFELPRL